MKVGDVERPYSRRCVAKLSMSMWTGRPLVDAGGRTRRAIGRIQHLDIHRAIGTAPGETANPAASPAVSKFAGCVFKAKPVRRAGENGGPPHVRRIVAGDRLRIVMPLIMRRRSGLNSTISLLLFSRLRFNSRNPSKQKLHPQNDPPFGRLRSSQIELQENSAQHRKSCDA
ncbi:hypothetical protein NKH10_31145 [Mesorhizobium sp. M1340]|uniref:hypothetical protein n=1 Tax=Mesorhizobium sp. M1340 TaxID=2957087 RepID=UPI003334C0F3